MMTKIKWLLCGLCLWPLLGLGAQSQVVFGLRNASFEGLAKEGGLIPEWQACGEASTPDLLPGPWGVRTSPSHGYTYLGLTTRENRSWERIGQRLSQPLLKDSCYQFRVDLARAPGYAGYNRPVCLRVWGGKTDCQALQLLASSPPIEHTDWQTYEFSFFAREDWNFFLIEAYYSPGTLFFYRGNLLIDAFSPFETCIRA